ncbi:putative phospholipase A2 1 [Asimina triloba]
MVQVVLVKQLQLATPYEKRREENAVFSDMDDPSHRGSHLDLLLPVDLLQRFPISASAVSIRYGKFCGVGWTGCPGEKPCDDLDECCKIHDECVEKKGMMNVKCHEKFKNCIKKVRKSGKTGFSTDCPYETAMPTMIQGMDMAIFLSQLGNQKLEL